MALAAGPWQFKTYPGIAARLTADMGPTDTACQVSTLAPFPAKAPFPITIDGGTPSGETVWVTQNPSGQTLSGLVRGAVAGAGAVAHIRGAFVEGTFTAESLAGAAGPPLQSPPLVQTMMIGDSETFGADNLVTSQETSGWRREFWRQLRARRGDVRLLGPVVQGTAPPNNGDGGLYVLGEWNCVASSGSTLETQSAALASDIASYGAPDLLIWLGGTNDFPGHTAAQVLAIWQSAAAVVMAALAATNPNAIVVVCSVPPNPSHVTQQQGFNAGLPAAVAALGNPNWIFCDACQGLTQAGLNSGLVHMNENGSASVGTNLADLFMQLYPHVSGRTYPRSFMPRTAPADVATLTNAGADYIDLSAAQQPVSAQSFIFSFWLLLTALSGSTRTLLATRGAGSGFALTLTNSTLTWTFDNPALTATPYALPDTFLKAGQWSKVGLAYTFADPLTGFAGLPSLWWNGMLIDVFNPTTEPFGPVFTAPALVLGFSASRGGGFAGQVAEVQATYGANVPFLSTARGPNLRDVMERNYFEDVPLPATPTSTAAWDYILNGDATDACGGPSLTGGSFTFAAAATPMPIDPP